MKQIFNKRTFTIGGDPEFVLKNTKDGVLVQAANYNFFNHVGEHHKIGRDGAAHPVEIRPQPTYINKLDIMLGDIDNIIKRIGVYCKKQDLTILCGAYPLGISIGGHIHFGGRDVLEKGTINSNDRYRKRDNVEKLVYMLDYYLTPVMHRFIDYKEIAKRSGRGYGKIHAYRHQNWGIEYRTPYSFLASPLMTRGLYALACLVAHHYYKVKITMHQKEQINRYGQKLSNGYDPDTLEKEMIKIAKPKIMRMMSLYSPNPQYNGDIISLFNLIEQNKKLKTNDVLVNYGLKEQSSNPIISLLNYTNKMGEISKTVFRNFKGKEFTLLLEQVFWGSDELYLGVRYDIIPKKMFKNIIVKTLPHTDTMFDLHLGLTQALINALISDKAYMKWFLSYINKVLKLEKEDV